MEEAKKRYGESKISFSENRFSINLFGIKTHHFVSLRARAVRVLSPFLSRAARQAENKIVSPKSFFVPLPLYLYIVPPPGVEGGEGGWEGPNSVKNWKIK